MRLRKAPEKCMLLPLLLIKTILCHVRQGVDVFVLVIILSSFYELNAIEFYGCAMQSKCWYFPVMIDVILLPYNMYICLSYTILYCIVQYSLMIPWIVLPLLHYRLIISNSLYFKSLHVDQGYVWNNSSNPSFIVWSDVLLAPIQRLIYQFKVQIDDLYPYP